MGKSPVWSHRAKTLPLTPNSVTELALVALGPGGTQAAKPLGRAGWGLRVPPKQAFLEGPHWCQLRARQALYRCGLSTPILLTRKLGLRYHSDRLSR